MSIVNDVSIETKFINKNSKFNIYSQEFKTIKDKKVDPCRTTKGIFLDHFIITFARWLYNILKVNLPSDGVEIEIFNKSIDSYDINNNCSCDIQTRVIISKIIIYNDFASKNDDYTSLSENNDKRPIHSIFEFYDDALVVITTIIQDYNNSNIENNIYTNNNNNTANDKQQKEEKEDDDDDDDDVDQPINYNSIMESLFENTLVHDFIKAHPSVNHGHKNIFPYQSFNHSYNYMNYWMFLIKYESKLKSKINYYDQSTVQGKNKNLNNNKTQLSKSVCKDKFTTLVTSLNATDDNAEHISNDVLSHMYRYISLVLNYKNNIDMVNNLTLSDYYLHLNVIHDGKNNYIGDFKCPDHYYSYDDTELLNSLDYIYTMVSFVDKDKFCIKTLIEESNVTLNIKPSFNEIIREKIQLYSSPSNDPIKKMETNDNDILTLSSRFSIKRDMHVDKHIHVRGKSKPAVTNINYTYCNNENIPPSFYIFDKGIMDAYKKLDKKDAEEEEEEHESFINDENIVNDMSFIRYFKNMSNYKAQSKHFYRYWYHNLKSDNLNYEIITLNNSTDYNDLRIILSNKMDNSDYNDPDDNDYAGHKDYDEFTDILRLNQLPSLANDILVITNLKYTFINQCYENDCYFIYNSSHWFRQVKKKLNMSKNRDNCYDIVPVIDIPLNNNPITNTYRNNRTDDSERLSYNFDDFTFSQKFALWSYDNGQDENGDDIIKDNKMDNYQIKILSSSLIEYMDDLAKHLGNDCFKYNYYEPNEDSDPVEYISDLMKLNKEKEEEGEDKEEGDEKMVKEKDNNIQNAPNDNDYNYQKYTYQSTNDWINLLFRKQYNDLVLTHISYGWYCSALLENTCSSNSNGWDSFNEKHYLLNNIIQGCNNEKYITGYVSDTLYKLSKYNIQLHVDYNEEKNYKSTTKMNHHYIMGLPLYEYSRITARYNDILVDYYKKYTKSFQNVDVNYKFFRIGYANKSFLFKDFKLWLNKKIQRIFDKNMFLQQFKLVLENNKIKKKRVSYFFLLQCKQIALLFTMLVNMYCDLYINRCNEKIIKNKSLKMTEINISYKFDYYKYFRNPVLSMSLSSYDFFGYFNQCKYMNTKHQAHRNNNTNIPLLLQNLTHDFNYNMNFDRMNNNNIGHYKYPIRFTFHKQTLNWSIIWKTSNAIIHWRFNINTSWNEIIILSFSSNIDHISIDENQGISCRGYHTENNVIDKIYWIQYNVIALDNINSPWTHCVIDFKDKNYHLYEYNTEAFFNEHSHYSSLLNKCNIIVKKIDTQMRKFANGKEITSDKIITLNYKIATQTSLPHFVDISKGSVLPNTLSPSNLLQPSSSSSLRIVQDNKCYDDDPLLNGDSNITSYMTYQWGNFISSSPLKAYKRNAEFKSIDENMKQFNLTKHIDSIHESKYNPHGYIQWKALCTKDGEFAIAKLIIPPTAYIIIGENKKNRVSSAWVACIYIPKIDERKSSVIPFAPWIYDDILDRCMVCQQPGNAIDDLWFVMKPCMHIQCHNCYKECLINNRCQFCNLQWNDWEVASIDNYADPLRIRLHNKNETVTCNCASSSTSSNNTCHCKSTITTDDNDNNEVLEQNNIKSKNVSSSSKILAHDTSIVELPKRERVKKVDYAFSFMNPYGKSLCYRTGFMIHDPNFDCMSESSCAGGIHCHDQLYDTFRYYDILKANPTQIKEVVNHFIMDDDKNDEIPKLLPIDHNFYPWSVRSDTLAGYLNSNNKIDEKDVVYIKSMDNEEFEKIKSSTYLNRDKNDIAVDQESKGEEENEINSDDNMDGHLLYLKYYAQYLNNNNVVNLNNNNNNNNSPNFSPNFSVVLQESMNIINHFLQ